MKRKLIAVLLLPLGVLGADYEIEYPTNAPPAGATAVDECAGGYATPSPFWYPVAEDEGGDEIDASLVPVGDVMSAFAAVSAASNGALSS